MVYTSPIYTNELVEVNDIITESNIAVEAVEVEVRNPSTGEMQKVTASQVSVDYTLLFR